MIADLKPSSDIKDSGVPWLGEIPEHWGVERAKWLFRKMDRPVRDIDEVVTCFRDGTVTLRRNRRVTGFTEALQETGYQGIRRGDLVIHAMDAFAGAVGVADSDGKGTPVYAVCQPMKMAYAQYYAYALREMARSRWIEALARGVRERSTDFRFDEFTRQVLPVPPITDQIAIVRFLDHTIRQIQHYIRAKQRLIKLLKEQRQTIIQRAVTHGVDQHARLKPSSVEWPQEIPEHWEILALKRVLRRLVDCEHKTAPAVDDSPFRVVRTSAVRHGQLRLDGTYCTTSEAYQAWTRRAVPEPGDVLFTREAPAGEACVVPDGQALCLGQRTVLMKVQRDKYDPEFLVDMIYAGPPRERIRVASQGSTVGHFNMDDIGWMQVLRPPLAEQREILTHIHRLTERLDHAMNRADREIALLGEYRTRLVADIVTGKLDVRDAAARLPDHVEECDSDISLELEEAEEDDLDAELEEVEV